MGLTNDEFDAAVQAALESLPDAFRTRLDNVRIEIHDRPVARILAEPGAMPDMLGFYIGVPLTQRSVESPEPLLPARILLFRENLRRIAPTRAALIREIRITLLHEIGHHFGLDEDRLAELGYD